MRRLKDILTESILDSDFATNTNVNNRVKMDNSLRLMKKLAPRVNSTNISKIKYSKDLDVNGNKLEVGDLVMYGYSSGGYDSLQTFRVGVVIGFTRTEYGCKVKLNVSGTEDKPITTSEYCGAVMKVTYNMVKNLYK